MALVKYNNNSISAITTAGQLASGGMVLIKEQTASSSSTVSFVDGSGGVVLDSTYPIYKFQLINIHIASDTQKLQFNFSTDSGSNYNVTKTTTMFNAVHDEGDSFASIAYDTGDDLAQGTGFQSMSGTGLGNLDDENLCAEMFLFNPSSTTFVKHYLLRSVQNSAINYVYDSYSAGYGNTTSAIDAVQFKAGSGNIDSGTIKLYGIKDS
jgi:hypothetical protein